MKVYVNYENKKWQKYNIDFEKLVNNSILKNSENKEVSITLVDDRDIHKLNKQYRNIDKPTNVLSFELGDDFLLGDIFISLDTVEKEAKSAGISVEEHTAHMVVHGMLHLQGYDHLNDAEALVMENKEIKILKKLGYNNPYEEKDVCSIERSFIEKILMKILNLKIEEGGFYQYLLYAVLGCVCSLGFAPFYLWPLSVLSVGVVYYLTIIQKKNISFLKSFIYVFPFGALYGISMFWWVLHSIYVIPELTKQFAIWTVPALFGIGLVSGVVFSLPFVIIRYLKGKVPCRAILFSCAWVLVLWCREWMFTGFPWNPLSNIMMTFPVVINSISLWGSLGLTFVILGVITFFIECFFGNKSKISWCMFFCFLIVFLSGCIYGWHNIHLSSTIKNSDSVTIRIVQPAKSAEYKMPDSKKEAIDIANQKVRDLFVWATSDNSINPDLIIFPETAYPYTVVDDNFPLARILNTNVIIGTNSYKDGKLYNSMVVADKTGKINTLYSKSHLVPFGEYRPFGDIIPTPGQLESGNGPEIISISTKHGVFFVAPAICYEIIFSDSLTKNDKKINAIVNITNDTWFGKTPGVSQHLDMVRRYAIESGLPIIRSNYSGISAFISSSGNIESFLPVGQNGILDGFVWGEHNTPYRSIGLNGCMIFILLFSIIVSISISVFQKKDC